MIFTNEPLVEPRELRQRAPAYEHTPRAAPTIAQIAAIRQLHHKPHIECVTVSRMVRMTDSYWNLRCSFASWCHQQHRSIRSISHSCSIQLVRVAMIRYYCANMTAMLRKGRNCATPTTTDPCTVALRFPTHTILPLRNHAHTQLTQCCAHTQSLSQSARTASLRISLCPLYCARALAPLCAA